MATATAQAQLPAVPSTARVCGCMQHHIGNSMDGFCRQCSSLLLTLPAMTITAAVVRCVCHFCPQMLCGCWEQLAKRVTASTRVAHSMCRLVHPSPPPPRTCLLQLSVVSVLCGPFMTSLDMAGASLTLLAVEPDMEPLLAAATDAPGWPNNSGEPMEREIDDCNVQQDIP